MFNRTDHSRLFYGYVVTAAGFGVWLIGWGTYSTVFAVFLKPLLKEFGWTRADASLAFALALIVQAAMGIIIGWLNDKLGPRLVIMVFGSCLGLSYLLLSRVNELWQFQLNYALLGGIGASTLTIPIMATVARWYIKRRSLMMGIVQAGIGIGGFIFPPFAGWLILSYGWRSACLVLGIITLVGMIIPGFFLRRDPAEMGQSPDGTSTGVAGKLERHELSGAAGFSLAEAIRTSQFWMLAGLHVSFGFCRSTFRPHLVAHVQDLGFSLTEGASILSITAISSLFGRIGMGRLADGIGNRPSFIIAFMAMVAVLIWGLIARDPWELYIFAIVFGFGWGGQAVLRFSVTTEVFGFASLGLLMGVLGFAESGAATFGSYFAGYTFDMMGSYKPAFWLGIAVSSMGLILAWHLKPVFK